MKYGRMVLVATAAALAGSVAFVQGQAMKPLGSPPPHQFDQHIKLTL